MNVSWIGFVLGVALGVGGGLLGSRLWLLRRAKVAQAENAANAAHAMPVSADLLPIKALLDSIDDLAWIKDTDSRFILVNRKFAEIFGVDPASLIGKTDADLSAPAIAEMYQHDDRLVMQSRQPSRQEEQIARKDGAIGWSETIKVPVLNSAGDVIGTAGVARDITERRQAQQILEERVEERTRTLSGTLEQLTIAQGELVRKEKMAALGSLVAGVAHELNTPIGNSLTVATTLQESTETLLEQVDTGMTRSALAHYLTSMREGTGILVRSLHNAAQLVTSFKQVAVDQSSANRREFKLAETVAEILQTHGPVIRRSGHTVLCAIADDISMQSYPGALGQVVVNLINNAFIHAFEGSTAGTLAIAAVPHGDNWVKLTISDDGRGMSTAILQRIFDPFFTTKLGQGGSGLGLSIVYSLVHDVLSGTIEVSSDGMRGSCFTLTLPLVARQAPSNPG